MTDRQENAPGDEPGAQSIEQGIGMPKDIIPDKCAEGKGNSGADQRHLKAVPDAPPAPEHKIASVDELPAVRDYLNRIGAQATSMLRAKIIEDEHSKYPCVVATIRFSRADGSVTADAPEYAPTEKEAEAISEAMTAARWVEIMPLDRVGSLSGQMQEAAQKDHERDWPKNFFEFRDATGKIVMVQIRVDREPGAAREKDYLNFTYWDDGQWRLAEPEVLPLWGQEQLADHTTVFLHEGAKAAAHCRWLTAADSRASRLALAEHPWGDELMGAAHLGWVGGAKRPLDTDWSVLAKAGVKRVYIVTDHDDEGESAVKPISKALAGADIDVDWIKFGDAFPPAFDLGDAFPAAMFQEVEGRQRYQGPMLRDCVFPATWATRLMVPPVPEGRGRPPAPKPVARKTFLRQWAVVTEEGKSLFVHRRDRRRKYAEESFNTRVRPFSDARNTADLLKSDPACAFDGLAYRPGVNEAEIVEQGRRLLNTWVRGADPMPEGAADEGPWNEYLAHLFPDEEDRQHVSRWLATLIARPAVRMRYGVLLFSNEHGTGKGTLCEVLRGVLGSWNVSVPSESEVVRSDYNDYLAHKTLVFVHEIYAGSTWKAYRNLKEKITDATIRVNAKYVPGYEIEARAHFILCSNASLGLTIEKQDRRFLVPRVAEQRRPQEEWDAFYGWLKGDGPAIIAGWAERYVSENGAVRESDLPPVTERKLKLIEDSRTPAHRALADLAVAALEKDEETGAFVSLVDADVAAWLKVQVPEANLPLNVVREALAEGGLFETKRLTIGGRKRTCCVTRAEARDVGAAEAQAYRARPEELLPPDM